MVRSIAPVTQGTSHVSRSIEPVPTELPARLPVELAAEIPAGLPDAEGIEHHVSEKALAAFARFLSERERNGE